MGAKDRYSDEQRRRREQNMKLDLEASAQELAVHTRDSLARKIEASIPALVEHAFAQRLRKAERADTPAEPHERVKGSKRNPKGSAASESRAASIKLSDRVISALKEDVKEHNAKASKDWQRVTLAQLKAVWRRGAGAFSVSHRPSQNRQSWAFARVKGFRRIVMGGGNPKYVQDNDLLHDQHPRRRNLKKARRMRGGEVDLVLELAQKMRGLYVTRLSALAEDLKDIQEDV